MRDLSRLVRKVLALLQAASRPADWAPLGDLTPLRDRAAVSAEALECRLLFALSAATGGSGLSANLSNNASVRKQQLICDPAPAATSPSASPPAPQYAPISGALSVTYNPADVSLADVEPAPGYTIDENASQVQVTSEGTYSESLYNYLYYVNSGGTGQETGHVDIVFTQTSATGTPGTMPLSPGYTEAQEAGPIGFDTFALTFSLLPGVPQVAPQYTVYADPNAITGQPDYLQQSAAAGGQTVVAGGPTPISPATVGGAAQGLGTTPDPSNPSGTGLVISDSSTKGNDLVQITPIGRSLTGSTGISVHAILNGKTYSQNYSQAFSSVFIYLENGNDTVLLAPTLSLAGTVSAGNGADTIALGMGTNTVTLGNGNDNVLAIGANNTVDAGDGNDNVVVGNLFMTSGTNSISLGNGRDNILSVGSPSDVYAGDGNDIVVLGNGSNRVQLGDGNDYLAMGAGDNQFVYLGNGNDTVLMGAGSDQTVFVGSGMDSVYLGNGSNDFVDVGSGNASITIGAGNNNSVFYNGATAPKVKFGKGTGNTVS